MKILANDGLDATGKKMLEAAGFDIQTEKIPQEKLADEISGFDVLIVRSATKVQAQILEAGKLKLIARAGVGLDNIDTLRAGELNIPVVNTPDAGSRSVAELVVAHMFSLARYLPLCNRAMPERGIPDFNSLKKEASGGFELKGKKLGIIGFGRIGQELARLATGMGMEILVYDHKQRNFKLELDFHPSSGIQPLRFELNSRPLNTVLENADLVSVHTPGDGQVIGMPELQSMKPGACLINCARGGVVNEAALLQQLNDGRLAFAALDVFECEPPKDDRLLRHPRVSLSPHIGASTREAQERVGIELASRIIAHFAKKE